MADYKTWKKVAEHVGVSDRAMRNLRNRPDWPSDVPNKMPKGGLSQAQLNRLIHWRTNGLQEDRAAGPAGDGAGADWSIAKKKVDVAIGRIRAEHEKLKLDIAAGRLVSRELLDGSLGGLASLFVEILTDLELALPARLEGMTAGQIEKQLQRQFDSARKRIVDRAEYELVKVSELSEHRTPTNRGRPATGTRENATE